MQDKDTKLSVIYTIDTEEFSESALSFLKQLPQEKMQFIMVDRICSEKTKKAANDLCDNYENAEYYLEEGFNHAQCWNKYSKNIKGKYVNFNSSHVVLNKDLFNNMLSNFGKGIFIVASNSKDNSDALPPNMMSFIPKKVFIDFNESPIITDLFINSYIFDKKITSKFRFREDIVDEESGTFFLFDIFENSARKCACHSMVFLSNLFFIYDDELCQRANDRYGTYNELWYTDIFKKEYIPMLENLKREYGSVPIFIQDAVFYCVTFRYLSNMDGRNKELLLGDELEEFLDVTSQLLSYIDDAVLTKDSNHCQYRLTYKMAWLLMSIKYRHHPEDLHLDFDIANNRVFAIINGHTYNISNSVQLNAINYKDGELTFDTAYMYSQLLDMYPDCIHAFVDGKEVPIEKNEIYSMTKYFSQPGFKKYTFFLKVKLNEARKAKIRFVVDIHNKKIFMPIEFFKPASRLTNLYPHAYWAYKDITLYYSLDRSIVVQKRSKSANFKKEIHFFTDLLRFAPGSFKIKEPLIRLLYWLLYPIYSHKRIWLYFDKLYKGGDNGEYACTYASAQNDGINNYYIINADSYDFKRIKKKGLKLIKFNSLHHKLMSLYAENIVATHPDIMWFCGYSAILQNGFRDKFNANLICIAHGITIQKNAEVQSRSYDNTQFYTTTSKYEVAHIKEPSYGYNDDEIALTGLARFDGLKSDDKKQILITPTWRKSCCGDGMLNEAKGYNPNFKHSNYFYVYNSLINDTVLINCAKETGYKLIFLLHPAMSAQIADYDRNDYTELIQASGDMSYEKILTQSSLMVTDYSGVQYDFAYQRKPLVYYHPSVLPPRFEEGALKYDTMGFGPICTNHDEIVETLCKYMRNNCKIEEEYKRRSDDFFAFDDFDNSKRIHQAIIDFTKRNEN